MKRILSWFVLYVLTGVVAIFTSLVIALGGYILGLIEELNTFLKIVCYFLGGTTLLSLLLAPAYYGSMLVVSACEAICPSKKGTRYIAYSIFMIILNIYYIISGITKDTIHSAQIVMCIYYVFLLILGRSAATDNYY